MKPKGAIILVIWIMQLHEVYGIIAYDCGSSAANLTTLSLLSVEECDIPQPHIESTYEYVQLLQRNDFDSMKVMQCKVEIDRTVRKCGMFSHTSDVFNGKYSYIEEITRDVCIDIQKYGLYRLGSTLITGLKPNSTTTRPITLAGHVDHDGACSGGAYSDPYGNWADVLVLGTVKITLQDYTATVRLNKNRVLLRSGVGCELNHGHCIDLEGGNTFWDTAPEDSCNGYSVLYQGYSQKIVDLDEEGRIIYTLTTNDTTFALIGKETHTVCARLLTRTEHPKLFIFESSPRGILFKRKPISPANMDMFAYVNSKFVYAERHIQTQIKQLYQDVLLQQCKIEQKTLQNALAIATQSPDIFAYHLMKGPGYMAVLAGEVIHVVKCVPVEVKIAHSTACYTQLPVLRGNATHYMTPQTHILLNQGTQTSCNALTPSMYHLEGSWYKFLPRPVEAIPPAIMKPQTKPEWKYINPGSLAISGIYSQTDLETLRDHIMFPAERPALLNTMARGIMGQPTDLHGGSLSNLLDEASLEKIVASTWDKFWNRFLIFGNVSAGIIGIYLIGRMIKLLLDTFIHGYALHSVYGWSVYLIGAVWDSLTHLLLHLGKRKKSSRTEASAPTCEGGNVRDAPHLYPLLENTAEYPSGRSFLPPEQNPPYSLELRG